MAPNTVLVSPVKRQNTPELVVLTPGKLKPLVKIKGTYNCYLFFIVYKKAVKLSLKKNEIAWNTEQEAPRWGLN